MMDSDFDDSGDDKSKVVRSALDALGDMMGKNGRKRGRPRKHPISSAGSDHKRSTSRVKASSESEENTSDDEKADTKKRRKRGSDDEEWDESIESLSVSQRREMRTRKKPTLYSEESYASNEARRKQLSAKRSHIGSNRPKTYNTMANRQFVATYNRPAPFVQAKLTKEEKEQHEKWRQQWRDIEQPLQAKQRILPLLRRGLFEKCLEQIAPVPGTGDPTANLPESIKSIFGKITCSAGFLEFLKNVQLDACVVMYDVCDKLFMLGEHVPDNIKIAQALRFWWNSLSFATRRKWEQYARSFVYNDQNKSLSMDDRLSTHGYEVPIHASAKRLADEEKWEEIHTNSLAMLDEIDTVVACPLCEKDENAEPCKMVSIKEIQEHFFHHHWQVHGYACQFCGTMFSTADDLMASHSDCQEWVAWNAARILTGSNTGKLVMSSCRMLLCCSDCGWYTTLSRRNRMDEETMMNQLKTFFSHHNNDGLLTMLIYFPSDPMDTVTSVRFPVTSIAGGDPQAPCVHCGPSETFRDPTDAGEHYLKEHSDMPLVCDECKDPSTTEYHLKQHQMSHVHVNSYFADFLTNTARVFPPPTNLSCAPRSGWKQRTNGESFAIGGLIGGVGMDSGVDLVDPREDVSEAKARLCRQRRKEGKPAQDKGYENPEIEEESSMARKVREKLRSKYSEYEGMGGFDDPVWLRDEEAVKFREWMEYWESSEGKKKGGPPREIEVDVSPTFLRIPTVEVELKFQDADVLSGFLLNENVFYCCECDTILKGEQAIDHLKKNGEIVNKCAMDEGEHDENPIHNENMFQLYSYATTTPDYRLPCPHCKVWSCSITGLRVHVMTVHGIYVKYTKVENENVANIVVLKFDLRTRLAKNIDAQLGMLPSGMLLQRRPIVTDVNVIDKSWGAILLTKSNCPPELLKSLQQFIELDKQSATPRVILAPPQPRGGIMQAYSQQRPPFRNDPHVFNRSVPTQRSSLEQSLQQQIQRGIQMPPGRLVNHATPLARTLNTVSRSVNHPQAALVRLRDGPTGHKKLVSLSYRDGEKSFYTCQVCSNSALYEQELLKAHLLRCHFHTCGHCTAIFAYEAEARMHARRCRGERPSHISYLPDPRLPHVKTGCPFCNAQLPMVDMHMHLMDFHINQLDFEIPHGRMAFRIRMLEQALPPLGKEPEVERLRYKYYVPPVEVAKAQGYQQCYACGLMLPDAGKLQIHLKLHPEFMYFCWLCPRSASSSLGQVPNIVKHIKEKHFCDREVRKGVVPCPQCGLNMFNRPLQHLMYECEHNFTCQLCRDLPAFESPAELREHREKCHYNALRRFECSHCTGYFATTQDFAAHVCDTSMMKTSCEVKGCKMEFKNRQQFITHFRLNHLVGDVCKICCIKYKSPDEQIPHWQSHGKAHPPADPRFLLLCAYGELTSEVKTLFTFVSNASFRLKNVQGLQGGSEDSPVQLSDDDDIIEIPSTAVQKERRQAAAAAAHVPLHHSPTSPIVNGRPRRPSSTHAHSPLPVAPPSDEAEVFEVVKRLVKSVVREEDGSNEDSSEERGASDVEMREEPQPQPNDLEDDDDILMLEDVNALSARVREEAEDTGAVGGLNQPGYKEDDEEPSGTPNQQPAIREFTPTDDDDLCVVAEVENPGCSTAAATISKGRAKKFGCPKCSDKFITMARLTAHLQSAHQFDAGQSTIMEEFGMPFNSQLWICKSCCLAFQTHDQKRTHSNQHGQQNFRCDTCAGSAYNVEVMNQHHRRIQEKKISYICGECRLEFETDTSLHEHSNMKHGVPLFYFCKSCEMGSTDGLLVYKHFMTGCHEGRRRAKTYEEALKCIGVIPAGQLHFQPTNVPQYKEWVARSPTSSVTPSLCNHRSMIVANERQVACIECRCLDTIQRHVACMPEGTSRQFEASLRSIRCPAPLLSIRQAFEKENRGYRQQPMEMPSRYAHGPGGTFIAAHHRYMNGGGTLPVATRYAAGHGQAMHAPVIRVPAFDEAQRRKDDRMQSILAARMNGAGSRPPVLTPGTGARHNYQNGGGPSILRGNAPFPSSRPPVLTRAPLSTMGSLQSIAAQAAMGGSPLSLQQLQQLQQSSSSFSVSSQPGSPSPPVSGQCSQCNANLLTDRDVFIHSLHTPDRGAFVCAACPIALRDERAAIKHIVNHLESHQRVMNTEMNCPMCGLVVSNTKDLKKHISTIHKLQHRTESCSLTFNTAALAVTHEEAHRASGRTDGECCVLCGSMDNWSEEMVDTRGKALSTCHLMKHACKHVYYCKICDMQKFDEESQIITHFVMMHMQEEGSGRSCNQCGVILNTENEYKNHCLAKHTITEMYVPNKMDVKVPQTFSDFLGVQLDLHDL